MDIRLKKELDLEEPMSEYEYLTHIQELGKKNKVFQIVYWFRISSSNCSCSYSKKYF